MPNRGVLRLVLEESVLIVSFPKRKKNRIYFPAQDFDKVYKSHEYDEFVFEDFFFFIFDAKVIPAFQEKILNPNFDKFLASERKKVFKVYIKHTKGGQFKPALYYYLNLPAKWRERIPQENYYMLMSKEVFIAGLDRDQLWERYKLLTANGISSA